MTDKTAKKTAATPPTETKTTDVAAEEVQPFKLADEGFDVTQPPSSDLDGKSVDYSKSTMPVVNDPGTPSDYNPDSNR